MDFCFDSVVDVPQLQARAIKIRLSITRYINLSELSPEANPSGVFLFTSSHTGGYYPPLKMFRFLPGDTIVRSPSCLSIASLCALSCAFSFIVHFGDIFIAILCIVIF